MARQAQGNCVIRPLRPRSSERWRRKWPGFYWLLTPESAKIVKSNAAQRRYFNVVQYLAPATMAGGPNLCPCHTAGCYGVEGENCIAGTGQLALPDARAAMIARTKFFHGDPDDYLERLIAEVEHYDEKARECGRRLALRLNGTSDVAWEERAGFKELFGMFPHVQFYDYTKVAKRVVRDGRPVGLPDNYHLTFSRSEANDAEVDEVMRRTRTNVAVVFEARPGRKGEKGYESEPLPREWRGRRVIDGDLHDLRFLDPEKTVVGLRAKGQLRTSMRRAGAGSLLFVVQDDPWKSLSRDPHVRKWLEDVAATSDYEKTRGPWSVTLSGDEWSFATSSYGIVGIRMGGMDFPPMPSVVEKVVIGQWLDSEKRVPVVTKPTMTVRALVELAHGRTTAKTPQALQGDPKAVLIVYAGKLRPLVMAGDAIASALRGAPPKDLVRLERVDAMADSGGFREGLYQLLAVKGPGWLALIPGTLMAELDAERLEKVSKLGEGENRLP